MAAFTSKFEASRNIKHGGTEELFKRQPLPNRTAKWMNKARYFSAVIWERTGFLAVVSARKDSQSEKIN